MPKSAKISSPRQAISIVTVSFNSSGVLPTMLQSIFTGDVATIIVDNGSDDINKISEMAENFNAKLICNKENVGFGRACNIGAAQVETEFILFLNPDVVVVDCKNALDNFARAAKKYPHAAAFNPAIESSSGAEIFHRSTSISKTKWKLARGWPASDREVPVLNGAALLVRKMEFDKIGGFDPRIFLYFEDDDLSLRLRSECGPLMFIRDVKVIHDAGLSSVNDIALTRHRHWHFGHSFVYTSIKHGRVMAFEKALLRAALRTLNLPGYIDRHRRVRRFSYLLGVISAYRYCPSPMVRFRNWAKSLAERLW